MKNSLKYLKLWRKKRSELQVNDDEQKDWLEMQSVLDQHMPVSADEEPSRSKGFKLLSLLLVTMSAAAMTFVFTYKITTKNHSHNINQHRAKKQTTLNINRSSNDSIADSLTANSIAFNKKDSLSLTKQSANIKNANITVALGSKSKNVPSNILSDTSSIFSGNNSSALSKKKNLLPAVVQNGNQLILQNKNQPYIAHNHNNKSMFAPFAGNKTSPIKPADTNKNNLPPTAGITTGQHRPGNLHKGENHLHVIRTKNTYDLGVRSAGDEKSDSNIDKMTTTIVGTLFCLPQFQKLVLIQVKITS